VFKDSEIKSDNQLVEIFESSGQKFMLLNGGPEFRINPLISLDIIYENTEGLDTAWEVLDPAKSKNLMDALLKMKKFEIAKLLVASR
jgi:predicted 3-demethylubiquinone-9 3-methyltransferase (glyoxalase superfamily)